MKKTEIKITHQFEKTVHRFMVVNPEKLSNEEVIKICKEMNVTSVFVNGRLYKL